MTQLTVEKIRQIRNNTKITGVMDYRDAEYLFSHIDTLTKQVDKQQTHIEVQFNKINALTSERNALSRLRDDLTKQVESLKGMDKDALVHSIQLLESQLESQKEALKDELFNGAEITIRETATRCAKIAHDNYVMCQDGSHEIRTEFQLS